MKQMKPLERISVIGSGTMGNGIAHCFAQYGYQVSLIDLHVSALEQALRVIDVNLDRQVRKGLISDEEKTATLSRIAPFTDVREGVKNAQLVVEAASENEAVKYQIFKELSAYCLPDCILASNTSSISITGIAAVTQRPEKVIGMHFMNPVPVMKLVEVIRGKATSPETLRIVTDVALSLEKVPVSVNDSPGFVANRILMPMINEAIYTLAEGVAGVEEIDTIMKLGMSNPMGPLALADFIGLDVCLAILNVLHAGLSDDKYRPCGLLVSLVNEGKKGKKSGEGFYDYRSGTALAMSFSGERP